MHIVLKYELREILASTLSDLRAARKKALVDGDWNKHKYLSFRLVEMHRIMRADLIEAAV